MASKSPVSGQRIRGTDASQDDDNPAPRKRARQSCDACKIRKTKCIAQGQNPCRYCMSIGAPCETSVKPRRRPYYRVSEEEYDSCMRLLRHFIPNTELDLDTMKAMIAEIKQKPATNSISPTASGTAFSVEREPSLPLQPTHELIETEESAILQEELGCMIIDSLGKYRYVGADSSLRFNHAAHAARLPGSSGVTSINLDPMFISPLINVLLPISPNNLPSSRPGDEAGAIYLPSREICMRYVTRFFDEIHCLYWFYSPEQFYSLLDKTLSDRGATSSASWLCSLYAIFALCSVEPDGVHDLSDPKSSADYLVMARALGLQVCDEADMESVKALAILSLAHNSAFLSVTAYLLLGMTVRIAFSLGLHRNVSPIFQDSVERERGRRLWWTIYLLDQEVAIQLGYPCGIVDEVTCIQTPFASEQILNLGSNTPPGYQAACVSLIKLKKKISQSLYVVPAQNTRKVQFQQVASCITSLRDVLAEIPSHLRWGPSIAPSHRRAVSVLGLRYWATLIHVTRPFLLYSVGRPSELRDAEKKKWYEELSTTCIEASENSVVILKAMYEHRILSSLLLFDSGCIQELVQVFLLAKCKNNSLSCRENLEFCMKAIRSMDKVSWCGRILPELTALVNESAVLDNNLNKSTTESERDIQSESAQHTDINEAFFDQYQNFEFNIDTAQLDVFDTLDFDMGTFSTFDMGWV